MTTLSDKFASAATTAQETGEGELMFIGEGKKYESEQEADKALAFKDDHIKTIEQENEALRASVDKAATLDDVLSSIQNQTNQAQGSTQQTAEEPAQGVDIDALVGQALDSRLSAYEIKQKSDSNSQSVVDELTIRYGERAGDLYNSKAAELGIDLDALSAASPKAVLEFFKEPAKTAGSYMASSQNTSNLNTGAEPVGTYKYWNDQIKAKKISREKGFQMQHKSLQEMGPDKFYSL